MSSTMEVRRYKRYRLSDPELTEDSPVKKKKSKNYDRYDKTKILSDLLNINYLRQRLQPDLEKLPYGYAERLQTDARQSIRNFVSKEETLMDVDIQGIKDHRPRELMENPNSFGLLFQENYKHDNKNPRGRVFDCRLGGQDSRFNKLQKEKELQYLEFRRRVELEKRGLKNGDKTDDGDDSDGDKNGKKIPHFKANVDGSIDTLPQAPLLSFPDLKLVGGDI